MNRPLGLSALKFKKLKELISTKYGRWHSINKFGVIRHGVNVLTYILHPSYTEVLDFCLTELPKIYDIDLPGDSYTTVEIIDESYAKYILGNYDLSTMGADFKFNTIRNVFRFGYKSKDYMINHYANKLSIKTLTLLKKEFKTKDVHSIFVPVKLKLHLNLMRIEGEIYDFVAREFNLLRASPVHCRSPISLVA